MRWGWYPSAKDRRRREQAAERKAAKIPDAEPIIIDGRAIATTFWGRSWCDCLERFSDYESRLPRGRSYVRGGNVVDLKTNGGTIEAQVVGSDLYKVKVSITPVAKSKWADLVKACRGSIRSIVELLEGQLTDSVMKTVISPQIGLFPTPKEITFSCSCPDWASMCKHVAAVLYGIGNRMDTCPDLLFQLREVDPEELLGSEQNLVVAAPASTRILHAVDLFEVFEVRQGDLSDPVPGGAPATPQKAAQRNAKTKRSPRKKPAVQSSKSKTKGGGSRGVAL